MKPNRVKRGPHHHWPRQNWLGSVMKRYFVHISLIGAKWIPKSFIPQKAFCNALAASELRNRNMSPSTQDSSMALLMLFVPYSLQYNMHRPNSKDILIFVPFFLLFPYPTYISLPARIQAEPVCVKTFPLLPVSHPDPSCKCLAWDPSVSHSLTFCHPYSIHPQRTYGPQRFRNI